MIFLVWVSKVKPLFIVALNLNNIHKPYLGLVSHKFHCNNYDKQALSSPSTIMHYKITNKKLNSRA